MMIPIIAVQRLQGQEMTILAVLEEEMADEEATEEEAREEEVGEATIVAEDAVVGTVAEAGDTTGTTITNDRWTGEL